MVQKVKKNILKQIDEEFLHTTDVLWNNEIRGNLLTASVMLLSAGILVLAMLLASIGVFEIDNSLMMGVLLPSLLELVVPSAICIILKGEKKWLKSVLTIEFAIVCCRVESVLTHNVAIFMSMPVIISVVYYSRPVTAFTAFIVTLFSGIAEYMAVVYHMGVINLNVLHLPVGSILSFTDTTSLREVIMNQANIDYMELWNSTLANVYLPKLIQFSGISIVCTEIAKRGRKMIFDQQAESIKSERIASELHLASDIQTNMLPNIFPPFPERTDFDIYASAAPAKEVGGDFYDMFFVDDKHLAIVIADVSGKGIPAAMFMVIAKTLIKDHSQLGLEPCEVFNRVNNLLCEGNDAGLFVTAWMGIINLESGDMTYVNAGHNPPVMMHDGKVAYLECKPGFVLAGLEDMKYRQYDEHLDKGDKLFLYTDGATEATDANNELYGEKRLLECLTRLKDKTVEEMLRGVRSDIDAFVKGAEQSDDLTLLAFDYSDKGVDSKYMEKKFEADDKELHNVLEFIEGELEKHDCSMKASMALTLAVEEIFVNIAHYAYEGNKGSATVGIRFEGDDVEIVLTDRGIPYNPLERDDPDINANIEERDIGGLGIYMTKKSVDECHYERQGNSNIFTMRKKIR